MDLLAKLENTLEGIFEGVFSRAFKAPLQPVEVAKRLTREMESHRTISVNATYVPNIYTVQLSPETYQEFQAISGRLINELEQYLRDFIGEHHYAAVGQIVVLLAENTDLRGHEINITVANREEAGVMSPSHPAPSDATQRTAAYVPVASEQAVILPPQALEVTTGEAQGRRIALAENVTIGRGPTNTLALNEPDVSRAHAEIVQQNDSWELRDLGSTNGTFVNDRRISTHALLTGDVIQIGHTTIIVR